MKQESGLRTVSEGNCGFEMMTRATLGAADADEWEDSR